MSTVMRPEPSRYEFALAERLGLDPERVIAGSMDATDRDADHVWIEWRGCAPLARDEYEQFRAAHAPRIRTMSVEQIISRLEGMGADPDIVGHFRSLT